MSSNGETGRESGTMTANVFKEITGISHRPEPVPGPTPEPDPPERPTPPLPNPPIPPEPPVLSKSSGADR